jgi:dUTP pyrophosphatase
MEITTEQPVVECTLEDTAQVPHYAHDNDTGADLFSSEDTHIKMNETKLVHTGLRIALPKGWGAFVLEKSGLALKGVQIMGGVIDEGYRGEIGVLIRNLSDQYIMIARGTKIAQLEVRPVYQAKFVVVENLDETERNEKGYGSTGV